MTKAVPPVFNPNNIITDAVSMYGGTAYGRVCDPVAKLVCSLIHLPEEYQPSTSALA